MSGFSDSDLHHIVEAILVMQQNHEFASHARRMSRLIRRKKEPSGLERYII